MGEPPAGIGLFTPRRGAVAAHQFPFGFLPGAKTGDGAKPRRRLHVLPVRDLLQSSLLLESQSFGSYSAEVRLPGTDLKWHPHGSPSMSAETSFPSAAFPLCLTAAQGFHTLIVVIFLRGELSPFQVLEYKQPVPSPE